MKKTTIISMFTLLLASLVKGENTQTFLKKDQVQYIKIALLLDTSNSMDGLINQAKSQLWDVVNEFSNAKCANEKQPELKIALYEYGNDNLSAREGYIRQVLAFSSDLDEISEKLFSLQTNGGEEYCGQVIQQSLKQLDWGKNPDDLKLIFIAGNEPFNQGKLHYKDAASQAKESAVVVNTIYCGNFNQGVNSYWKDGALRTGGEYLAIDHNQDIVYISTPYDKKIMALNRSLNNTYIGYGTSGKQKIKSQRTQDQNAYTINEEIAVKRALSKSSSLYKNKQWDLVDAIEDDDSILETVVESTKIPEELQKMDKKELKAYVLSKKKERSQIQKRNTGPKQ